MQGQVGRALIVLFGIVSVALLAGIPGVAGRQSSDLADAAKLLSAHKYDDAAKLFETIIRSSSSPQAYEGLIRADLGKGAVETAIQLSEKAKQLFPDSVEVATAGADVLYRQGKISEADSTYRRAIQKNPRAARAWYGLWRTSQAQFLRKAGHSYVVQAHRIAPQDAELAWAWALDADLPKETAKRMEEYLAAFSDTDPEREDYAREAIDRQTAYGEREECTLASAYEPTAIPLSVNEDDGTRWRYVAASLNDAKPGKFLIDSNATNIVVTRKYAASVGLQPIGLSFKPHKRRSDSAIADKFRVGSLEFHNCLVVIDDEVIPAGYAARFGQKLFSSFRIQIDYPAKALKLTTIPGYSPNKSEATDRTVPDDMVDALRAFEFGGNLFVKAKAGIAPESLFHLQSLSAENFVSKSFAPSTGAVLKRLTNAQQIGIYRDAYVLDRVLLRVGRFEQEDKNHMYGIDLFQMSQDFGVEISGIVGMPFLEQLNVVIDYVNGLVRLRAPVR